MGLDLIYTCGPAELSLRFTDAEWACLDRLRAVAEEAVDLLTNADDFGDPVTLGADDLAAAARAVAALLRDRPDLLPGTFQMRMERLPVTGEPDGRWQGGAISGLRLPGESDFFMIRVGPDHCEMERMTVGPDGRGMVVGKEDLRGRESVQTETVGRIDFRHRPAASELGKGLAEMQEFFTKHAGQQIVKVLC
jgi:hypothetical protein